MGVPLTRRHRSQEDVAFRPPNVLPGEYSTGDKTVRLPITKAGNAHVRRIAVEAAWHYQLRPTSGRTVTRRRKGQPRELIDIARRCDSRLNRKFQRMTSRGKRSTVAAVALRAS